MYENCGKKIKDIAQIFMWIGIIASIGFGIYLVANEILLYGLMCIILGPIFAWLGEILLYGFGILVENAEGGQGYKLMEKTNNVEKKKAEHFEISSKVSSSTSSVKNESLAKRDFDIDSVSFEDNHMLVNGAFFVSLNGISNLSQLGDYIIFKTKDYIVYVNCHNLNKSTELFNKLKGN